MFLCMYVARHAEVYVCMYVHIANMTHTAIMVHGHIDPTFFHTFAKI